MNSLKNEFNILNTVDNNNDNLNFKANNCVNIFKTLDKLAQVSEIVVKNNDEK